MAHDDAAIDMENGIAAIGADNAIDENGEASGLVYAFNVNTQELADVNDDRLVDVSDLDALTAAIASGSEDPSFDVNHDGIVDRTDRLVWIEALQHSFLGDSNLDGRFDADDLIEAFSAGEYQDAFDGNSTWSEGDWDGDGDFTTDDLLAAFADGGYDAGPRLATAVPEPSGCLVFVLGPMLIVWRRQRFPR